jgi:aspartyl-tRNA(Asn)/glutamyl-tRNA(Gln) amidotransferase subunit B
LTELKLLLTYLGVSDCNMQEGSLRVDANINLHVASSDAAIPTPIVEVKNMNSFRAVERALAFEAQRQYDVWLETRQRLGDVPKQTRGWDEQQEITRGQRHKEESSDYRYFPDPDLVPVTTTREQVEQIRSELGELPSATRCRLQSQYGLDAYDADVLVNQGRELVGYFEAVAGKCGHGKRASNWIQQDVLRTLNECELTIASFPVSADALAELIVAITSGDLDNTRAKDVFQEMVGSAISVAEAMKRLGIERVDEEETTALCRELLEQNPQVVADLKAGKTKAVGALIGQAKKRNPNVNPGQLKELFLQLVQQM